MASDLSTDRFFPHPPRRKRAISPVLAGLVILAAVLAVAILVGGLTLLTQKTITLTIDGQQTILYTRQRTVEGLLTEIGVQLVPQDAITPARETHLANHMTVRIHRAEPVLVVADGRTRQVLTTQRVPLDILIEAGISLGRYDRILLDGQPADPARPLTGALPGVVEVIRAVAMTVDVDGETYTLFTTAPTVGQTLDEMGIALYVADAITPPLETVPAEGMHVTVERSVPFVVEVDGVEVTARTRAATVGEALAEAGFALVGEDYSLPALDAPLPADGRIRIVRVTDDVTVERVEIPYATVYRPDPTLELDERRLLQPGVPGVEERRTHTRLEDGVVVSRVEETPRVVQPPTDEIIAYGTKVVVRTLDTPEGPLTYWRVIRMLATSYTPATSSKPPDAPNYGLAATGVPVEKGIVAVDPAVIPYFTQVYVPGYGIGLAADTGGAVNGRRIDLGYSDTDLVLWYSWTDVYLLTPVPASEDIPYLLP